MNTKQLALIIGISTAVSIIASLLLSSTGKAMSETSKSVSSVPEDPVVKMIRDQQVEIEQLRRKLESIEAEQDKKRRAQQNNVEPDAEEPESIEPEPEDTSFFDSNNAVQPQRPSVSASDIRKRQLINNGFSPDEANWILQNEMDVQLQSLYEQHRARRAQLEADSKNGTRTQSQRQQLRERLGDDYYQRYLEANGFPTSVAVSSVLNGSPGANAGLKPGDRIVSYAGERVFNIRELNALTVLGDQGRAVLIEVERNGEPVQLSLPRGPIGITGGRGRF